jgi:hypothetical protein
MNILQNNETFIRKEMKVPLQRGSVRHLHHPDRINNRFPSGSRAFQVLSKSVELEEDKTVGKQPTSFQLEANKRDKIISKTFLFFTYK